MTLLTIPSYQALYDNYESSYCYCYHHWCCITYGNLWTTALVKFLVILKFVRDTLPDSSKTKSIPASPESVLFRSSCRFSPMHSRADYKHKEDHQHKNLHAIRLLRQLSSVLAALLLMLQIVWKSSPVLC